MGVNNEKKQVLKQLISILQDKSMHMEDSYKKLHGALTSQIILVIVYIVFVLLGHLLFQNILSPISYEIINAGAFLNLACLSKFLLAQRASVFEKECRDGYVDFERLVNYVDWKAYRKSQLRSESEKKVLEALNRYSAIAQSTYSPYRSRRNIFKLIYYYLWCLQIVALLLGIYFYYEFIYESLIDEIDNVIRMANDERMLYYLIAITSVCMGGLLNNLVNYQLGRKVEIIYTTILDKYIYKLTHFSKFVYRFSEGIVYKSMEVEYVPELKSLVDRFASFGSRCTRNRVQYNVNTLEMPKLIELSESLNHLWYYLDDKLRYMEDGIHLDSQKIESLKPGLMHELNCYTNKYYGSKANWGLLRNAAGDLYCDEWLKIKNLPSLYKSSKRIVSVSKRILIFGSFMLLFTLVVAMLYATGALDAMMIIILSASLVALMVIRLYTTNKRITQICKQMNDAK